MVLSDKQVRILEALGKYRFLTNSQLTALNIGHINRVRENTRKLSMMTSKRKSLIGKIVFPTSAKFGRLENVFYLKKRGAEGLAEALGRSPEEFDFVNTIAAYYQDYWHRKYCIDFQIRLFEKIEIEKEYNETLEIPVFDRYFDKTGANRTKVGTDYKRLRARTRADFDGESYIIPDLNFIIQKKGNANARALFCMEMTNGKDTKRVLSQIEKHISAIQYGILAQKYHLSTNPHVLFLFSEKGLMEAVMRRFFEVKEAEKFKKLFFFSHIEYTAKDILNCWHRAESEQFYNFLSRKATNFNH